MLGTKKLSGTGKAGLAAVLAFAMLGWVGGALPGETQRPPASTLEIPKNLPLPKGATGKKVIAWLDTLPGGGPKAYGYGFREGAMTTDRAFFAVGAGLIMTAATAYALDEETAVGAIDYFADTLALAGIPYEGVGKLKELVPEENPPREALFGVIHSLQDPLSNLAEGMGEEASLGLSLGLWTGDVALRSALCDSKGLSQLVSAAPEVLAAFQELSAPRGVLAAMAQIRNLSARTSLGSDECEAIGTLSSKILDYLT